MPHKFCPDCGGRVVCDFCVHFNHDGAEDPAAPPPLWQYGYREKGWCRKYKRRESFGGPNQGSCDDFECCMGEVKTEEVSQ